MKNLLFLAGLVFGMMFVACSSDDDDASSSGHGGDIVGVWKYVGIDVYSQQTYMDFMSNGTYIVIDVSDRDIRVGTWKRSGKKITIGLTEGKETDYEEEAEYKIEDGKLYITSEKTGVVLTIVAQRASEDEFSQYLTIQKIDDFLKDKPVFNLNDFISNDNLLCPDKKHPHVIDLGEAGKWACCNVGASIPEEFGGYYAWGETEEKEYYDWSTYKHCDGSNKTCHNIGDDIAGTKYDVAHVKWGGSWKMPSLERIELLLNKCESKWLTIYDMGDGNSYTGDYLYVIDGKSYIIENGDNYCIYNGKVYDISGYDNYSTGYCYLINEYVFTNKKFSITFYGDHTPSLLSEIGLRKYGISSSSKDKITGRLFTGKNGNSIFLPVAGYRWGDNTSNVGNNGGCWSSTQGPDSSGDAYYLYFNFGDTGWNNYYRSYGRSVRPVTE